MPKVSIIIPAFNAEKYIEECVSSVLRQSYTDIEVVVIDDGSTDRTPEILQKLAEKDSRLTVLREENKGQPSARNLGLDVCNGEYIQFVDSDDTLAENMTETLVKNAVEGDFDVVVCSYKNYITYKNTVEVVKALETVNEFNNADFCITLNKLHLFNAPWNKIYKKKAVEHIRFENIIVGEDLLYNIMVFKNKVTYRYIDIPLYNYYSRGEESIVSTFRPKLEESKDRIYQEWISFFENNKTIINNKNNFLNGLIIDKYLSLTLNIYRNKSTLSNSDRIIYIESKILKKGDLYSVLKTYKPEGRIPKFFALLCSLKNAQLINMFCLISTKLRRMI